VPPQKAVIEHSRDFKLAFELAKPEHAYDIQSMREESSHHLTAQLGEGHWSHFTKIASVRDRIRNADPIELRSSTIFVAAHGQRAYGSVVVSTFHPGFWKKHKWEDPRAKGLGVFNLVVPPERQGSGIGRFLMEGVESLARTHRIPYVRLDAYEANPYSNAFYARLGYQNRGRIDVRGVGLNLFEKRVD
jgi:ribosomal protein S18 acetylase RimI-like enzyme